MVGRRWGGFGLYGLKCNQPGFGLFVVAHLPLLQDFQHSSMHWCLKGAAFACGCCVVMMSVAGVTHLLQG